MKRKKYVRLAAAIYSGSKKTFFLHPHLDCNLLNGIMRQKVLGMASDLDIEVRG